MKIGFIAMSGVRAESKKLNEVGLTLPGFVERKEVIASLPSLGLLTLAGMTPDDIDVEYHEIRDLRVESPELEGYDLVAISSFSAQILDAYEVADRCRALGIPVVMGGLHVTMKPDEALEHATSIIIGEGEMSWPRLMDDWRRGELQQVYRPASGQWFDLRDAPMPRHDLLDISKYNRLTVQTARGCPHRCSFCASSILLTPKYRVKPVEKVIEEIRAIKKLWKDPFIEFADDNSFVQCSHGKDLMRALAKENVHWFTEADVSIAEDEELLELMAAAGCRQVLIGFESPSAGLEGLELRADWKRKRITSYKKAIATIQSHGITVNGCFILGLDGQTEDVFDEVFDFVVDSGLYEVQVTVLTAFPGTPLHRQLEAEGRLLEPENWRKCTLFDVNFIPDGMSAERLEEGLIDLSRRLYDPEVIKARRKGFFRRLRQASRLKLAS